MLPLLARVGLVVAGRSFISSKRTHLIREIIMVMILFCRAGFGDLANWRFGKLANWRTNTTRIGKAENHIDQQQRKRSLSLLARDGSFSFGAPLPVPRGKTITIISSGIIMIIIINIAIVCSSSRMFFVPAQPCIASCGSWKLGLAPNEPGVFAGITERTTIMSRTARADLRKSGAQIRIT